MVNPPCHSLWSNDAIWRHRSGSTSLIAKFMGPTWESPGADRTQVGPMWATWTLLSGIGSANGVLPNGTKPLVEPMLIYLQLGSVTCAWEQLHRKCSRIQLVTWIRKLHLKFLPHLPGTHELTLYVPNLLEGTKTCIYILYHFSTLMRRRLLKSFLK